MSKRTNYFNTLTQAAKLDQLGRCRFMQRSEFASGIAAIAGKKIVVVGCGAQGLNQGLNMRDSGCDVSYTLRQAAIDSKRQSWVNATSNNFAVGTYEELIPQADLVLNLTPDKQHSSVVQAVMPLMKKGATLAYSHGFNIVEEGMQIRPDLTVIMVAPKCPGSEVRAEYKRGFGVPTLIAVHPENDPRGDGLEIAKAYAAATGGDRAGVLESSFVAEVKSDLMGEQTILCGMLQTGAVLSFDKMVAKGIDKGYASKLIQYGWETITEALKHGGITGARSSAQFLRAQCAARAIPSLLTAPAAPARHRDDGPPRQPVEDEGVRARRRAQGDHAAAVRRAPFGPGAQIGAQFGATPLSARLARPPRRYRKHQDDIITGAFSSGMMADWDNDDANLHKWRAETAETGFEKTAAGSMAISEQEYFDNAVLMVAMVKAGVELAFDAMVEVGMKPESAYYESLHETPLIANTIARMKLYEMNSVISDTAEYGCYLYDQACRPLLTDFMKKVDTDVIGTKYNTGGNGVDNRALNAVNEAIRSHPVEVIGKELRGYMTDMERISVGGQ